ncbi:hypothetical protein J2X06_003376 [Lysobacter niastensis]|uniref:MarR family transcriptional regulator n=1 Tax=Lysobacter niastensis TaxID=380629 RepID=A0ABU1WEZ7_9GAMM|nr:hypothetical protein [Lysobacter niastensis]MDR7136158.1 hypothetical protein [Lysobacter niastensis]
MKHAMLQVVAIAAMLSGCGRETGQLNGGAGASAPSVFQVVKEIDRHSRDKLGVGLAALGMLEQADPKSYVLEDSLSSTQLRGLAELEKQGLIKLTKVQAQEGVFLHFVPTEKGMEMLKAMTD